MSEDAGINPAQFGVRFDRCVAMFCSVLESIVAALGISRAALVTLTIMHIYKKPTAHHFMEM